MIFKKTYTKVLNKKKTLSKTINCFLTVTHISNENEVSDIIEKLGKFVRDKENIGFSV